MKDDKIDNFERAFTDSSGGCVRTCNCGVTYFDDYNTGYSWDDGEIEKLRDQTAMPNAKVFALDYAPSDLSFEGKQYVDACTCWHPRAEHIIGFIEGHARAIARYLSLEKERKQAEAAAAPVVE